MTIRYEWILLCRQRGLSWRGLLAAARRLGFLAKPRGAKRKGRVHWAGRDFSLDPSPSTFHEFVAKASTFRSSSQRWMLTTTTRTPSPIFGPRCVLGCSNMLERLTAFNSTRAHICFARFGCASNDARRSAVAKWYEDSGGASPPARSLKWSKYWEATAYGELRHLVPDSLDLTHGIADETLCAHIIRRFRTHPLMLGYFAESMHDAVQVFGEGSCSRAFSYGGGGGKACFAEVLEAVRAGAPSYLLLHSPTSAGNRKVLRSRCNEEAAPWSQWTMVDNNLPYARRKEERQHNCERIGTLEMSRHDRLGSCLPAGPRARRCDSCLLAGPHQFPLPVSCARFCPLRGSNP